MADQEHVAIAERGAAAIVEWMQENPGVVLDLRGADLRGANLLRTNLLGANLSGTDLRRADLSEADLNGANLRQANLSRANLSGANLLLAIFSFADLSDADVSDADLTGTDLSGADLSGANLSNSVLSDADLSQAIVGSTTFGRCDLSQVSGLETVRHEGPSSVGTDTLLLTYRGAGNRLTPELRGFFIKAGVPAPLLEAIPTIASKVRYHSAFIAYGEPDRAFAKLLYTALQSNGVSCWTYAMDATPGERTWHEIRRKRLEAGKFIVLCSAAGLVRDGPQKEIEEQMDDDPGKIIPISRDDLWRAPGFQVQRTGRDLKAFLLERNYANFSPEADYANAFEWLLKALELRPDAPST